MADAYNTYNQGQSPAHSNGQKQFKRWGTREVEISSVRFLNQDGQETDTFHHRDPLTMEIAYMAHKPIEDPEFGLAIYRQDGVHVNGPNTKSGGLDIGVLHGPGIIRYHIAELPLLPARSHVTVALHDSRLPVAYDHHEQAYSFRVVSGDPQELYGLLTIPAQWEWAPEAETHLANSREN